MRSRDAAHSNNGHHPGYEAAVQALRTRGGEPTALFYALIVMLAGGWGWRPGLLVLANAGRCRVR